MNDVVTLERVRKGFRRTRVLEDVSFALPAGSVTVMNGRQLARLDLVSGERTVLWPTRPDS